jgi:hypothetical protein
MVGRTGFDYSRKEEQILRGMRCNGGREGFIPVTSGLKVPLLNSGLLTSLPFLRLASLQLYFKALFAIICVGNIISENIDNRYVGIRLRTI